MLIVTFLLYTDFLNNSILLAYFFQNYKCNNKYRTFYKKFIKFYDTIFAISKLDLNLNIGRNNVHNKPVYNFHLISNLDLLLSCYIYIFALILLHYIHILFLTVLLNFLLFYKYCCCSCIPYA